MSESLLHIDPKVLASIHDMDWAVRLLASGHYAGRKNSNRLGTGMEFSQYRPYSQGDDLRQLDWKMLARTDKYYIKQSEIETNIDVGFIIDNSRSMRYKEGAWDKLSAAKMICAVLGFVALKNGDWIRTLGENQMKPGNDSRHWKRFLNSLQSIEEQPTFTAPKIANLRSKEIIVFVSDLYDDQDEILSFVQSLKSSRNEVVVFHLLGEKESTLDFGGAVKMQDLETGAAMQFSANVLQANYMTRIQSWQTDLSDRCLSHGIDYNLALFNTPLADTINSFLRKRKQLL